MLHVGTLLLYSNYLLAGHAKTCGSWNAFDRYLTEAELAVTVHNPFRQIDVPILPFPIYLAKSCAEDWFSISFHAKVNILSSLGEVYMINMDR